MAEDYTTDDWARAMRGMVYGQGPRSLMDIDPFTGRDKSGAFNIPAGVPMQGAPQGGGMMALGEMLTQLRGGKERAVQEALGRALLRYGASPDVAKLRNQKGAESGLSGLVHQPIGEMSAAYLPTVDMAPRKPMSWEELHGSTITPMQGDRTIAGMDLTHINERPLANKVGLYGGPDFPRANPGKIWASAQALASGLRNKLAGLQKSTGGDVWGVYSPLAGTNVDFSTPTANAVREQLPGAKMAGKDKKEFDRVMREDGFGDFGPQPNWPGLNKVSDEWIRANSDGRKKMVKLMDTKRWQQAGAPDIASTRYAVTNPSLLAIPTGMSGYTAVKVGKPATAPGEHPTYDTDVLGAADVRSLPPVPDSVLYEDFNKDLARTHPGLENPSQRQYIFGRNQSRISQKVDDQMLERIRKYQSLMQMVAP